MSIINKATQMAKKVTQTVAGSAERKINEVKQKRIEVDQRLIQEFPYKYRYIVKQRDTISVDILLGEILERDSYVVFDSNESPLFLVKGTILMGKHHFTIFDANKREVGKIRKALVNMPIPFEKEKKSCSLELPGLNPITLSTYISFGDREYSVSEVSMKLNADSKEKEFRLHDNHSGKTIAHVYKVRTGDGLFHDKYYVGFDNINDMMLAISMTIGIDIIRYSSD